jgi:hypothetical protein
MKFICLYKFRRICSFIEVGWPHKDIFTFIVRLLTIQINNKLLIKSTLEIEIRIVKFETRVLIIYVVVWDVFQSQ